MAFTMENYLTKETINDSRHVKWIVRMYGRNKGEYYEDILPYHKCTEEDYSQFSPLDKLSEPGFEKVRQSETRSFYCLDEWPDDMKLGGDMTAETYRRLEIIFSPCNYIHTHMGYEDDFVSEECVSNFEEQTTAVGPINILWMVSYEKFYAQDFGKDKIKRRTKVMNQQVDQKTPIWIGYEVTTNVLQDETDFLQIGQSDLSKFYSESDAPGGGPTSWNQFPTAENPLARYKYASL